MIPQRTLAGTCEITTGALAITQRPPIYTGESAALKVEISFTFQNVAYPIPSGVVAEMYLKFPNTEKMTVAVPMEISGNTASGVLSGEQTGLEGYPLLIIQLTDTETASLIVACATTVKVSNVRGNLVVDTRAPTPSEIVYVGRSPYIDPTTKHWITWDSEQAKYVDTGINAEGVIGFTPNISIGTVQSVPTGESAEVTRTGTDQNPVLNFKLPRSGDGVGIYPVSIPIAVADWVEESGVYKYTFSDATIKAYMTVLESWLDDETVQLRKVWYTVNNGSLIVNTDVVPTAAWVLHVTLGTDGTDVLEDVADITQQIGDLTDLETTVKTDIVSAVNENTQQIESLNTYKTDFINLGIVANNSAAWDAIPIYDKTVIGQFFRGGQYMFMAYKYSGSQYGMMICYRYSGTLDCLQVANGVKTWRNI